MDEHERRAERISLRAEIDFRRAGEHRWRVEILDMSPEGCRVEVPISVGPEDVIWISFPGLETIQGKICWVKEWTVGIEFENPLHPAVFDMLQQRIRGGS